MLYLQSAYYFHNTVVLPHKNISTKSKDIQCAYSDCPITLNTTRGIKDHMSRCHRDFEPNIQVDSVPNIEQLLTNETEADFEKYVGSIPIHTSHGDDIANNQLFVESIK